MPDDATTGPGSGDGSHREAYGVIFVAAACMLAVWVYWRIDEARHGLERRARASIRDQIPKVASGLQDALYVDGADGKQYADFQLCELSKDIGGLKDVDHFALAFGWRDDTDELLKLVHGLTGIRRLHVRYCGLTDAGMDYIASMANLEELELYCVSITDTQLAKLAASPKLESLTLMPPSEMDASELATITIPAVLGLPHLEDLTLHERPPSKWLEAAIEPLREGTMLKALTLVTERRTIPKESISMLQAALPNCDVKAFAAERHGYRASVAPSN